ncbi:hypothetical protein M3I54_32830 [Paraburkholderia sp. CNPSo 3274]|nr:hypothetical protein [Paraburkholderia sp. CNPSo 3274]MCP3711682.1 hypothetical protein [Paraburkholderia sp. CNPSo 3274]
MTILTLDVTDYLRTAILLPPVHSPSSEGNATGDTVKLVTLLPYFQANP